MEGCEVEQPSSSDENREVAAVDGISAVSCRHSLIQIIGGNCVICKAVGS